MRNRIAAWNVYLAGGQTSQQMGKSNKTHPDKRYGDRLSAGRDGEWTKNYFEIWNHSGTETSPSKSRSSQSSTFCSEPNEGRNSIEREVGERGVRMRSGPWPSENTRRLLKTCVPFRRYSSTMNL
jgi:hypothetical protein